MSTNIPFLLFENTAPDNHTEPARLFTRPVDEIIATDYAQLPTALARIDEQRRNGHYLAGFIAYEAAYDFSAKLHPLKQSVPAGHPLLHFYVFDRVQNLDQAQLSRLFQRVPESTPYIKNWSVAESKAQYIANLKQLHTYIQQGDVYQVNHTFRANFELEGSVTGLYQALRQAQPVAYSALLHLPQGAILSLSPELFLSKQGKVLTTKPMKGTAARGEDALTDQWVLAAMQDDKKLHAENLMIVDLMRNDIGRIARPGSVSVKNLFEIQTYKTLHQMISTVQGDIDPEIPFAEIIRQLFPCGSITGAPKIRSMEIIHELENTPRHVYTGALGFITPENDFTFNVPIRTLYFPKDSQRGTVGIGGGIIYESDPEAEWKEALLKARFLTGLNTDFQLIETFRYDAQHQVIPRLKAHLSRLENSAIQFGFPVDIEQWHLRITQFTEQLADTDSNRPAKPPGYKIRLLLDAKGRITLSSEVICSIENQTHLPQITLSKQPIDRNSLFRRHKTTRRTLYNQGYALAERNGFYDVLFLNEQGYIAEASRHNLVIEIDGRYYTPPISDGALPGIMRQQLLEDTDFSLIERQLTLDGVQQADRLYLCNSVRGLVQVDLPEGIKTGTT